MSTFYFKSTSGDTNLDSLSCWFIDNFFYQNAPFLPTSTDMVQIYSPVTNITNGYIGDSITFLSAAFFNCTWGANNNITLYATNVDFFNSANQDIVIANSISFNGSSSNSTITYAGSAIGTVTFNDNSINGITSNVDRGEVIGDAILNDNSSNSAGHITGNLSVYYPANRTIDGIVEGVISYYGYPIFISPNQTINLFFGELNSEMLDFYGDGPFTINGFGLPAGISIDNTGIISGVPSSLENRNSFIRITNNQGQEAFSLVKFTIAPRIQETNNFYISPPEGFSKTKFRFTSNISDSLSAYYLRWDFGDNTTSTQKNPTHSYFDAGLYNVTLNAYTSGRSVFSITSTLKVSLALNESVYFDFVPPPTFAGHLNRYPFVINFTSSQKGPHYIDLAAQFSRSYSTFQAENKWEFLRPHWRFLDLNQNPIDVIVPEESEIYTDDYGKINHDGIGIFAGVTGTASFYFVDDIYNFDLDFIDKPHTTLIATLRTSGIPAFDDSLNIDNEIPSFSNSLAYATCPYTFLLRPPDNIKITENGIRDYINPRWPTAAQPILVNTNFTGEYPDPWKDGNSISPLNAAYQFCHFLPIDNNSIPVKLGTVGISSTLVDQRFVWIDGTGYKTPGYYKGSFKTKNVTSKSAYITGSLTFSTPVLSAQFYNPTVWVSNPEAGMMASVNYIYNDALSSVNTKNLNIASVHSFNMPIITNPDFANDPMALSGFHGINSIASLPAPTYHAWALDSEMNSMYRINTRGQILCAVDINKIVKDNNLGFLTPNQVSPASIVLDSNENIWVTLYDTVSTLKFDRIGNFLFAVKPPASYLSYKTPPNMNSSWYKDNEYYNSALTDNIDINFIEPTGIDVDTNDNVWVTYSNFMSGFAVKYSSSGSVLNTLNYPICASPQSIAVDTSNNVWIAVSNNIYNSKQCKLEKRNSNGSLLSSFEPIQGLNHINLDYDQNIWFTFGYNNIGTINTITAEFSSIKNINNNISFLGISAGCAPDFDPNKNTDETALEGIACDLKGRVYTINSIENQIYVYDTKTKEFLNSFYVNPQGFTFYSEDQYEPTIMSANLWNKSLQATGDWTGLKWFTKFHSKIPNYSGVTGTVSITGRSVNLDFLKKENYDIFKVNENFDLAKHMQSLAFQPTLIESKNLFENFLASIYGTYPFNHTDIGVAMYEKIANYLSNKKDIDYCNLNELYDTAEMVGIDAENYHLDYPVEIHKLIDLFSINQSRLQGARSKEQSYFTEANSQGNYNIKGNPITSLSYVVTANTPLILKDRSLNKYRLVPTGTLYELSQYPLQTLAESLGLTNHNWPSYYEFYEFNPSFDLKQIEGIIDWSNPQTTLNETLSTRDNWFGDSQLVEIGLSYQLYKGLNLIP